MSKEKRELKIKDKRHWVDKEEGDENATEPDVERLPTYVDNLKKQVEAGEGKLKEYIAAYKKKMAENDEFRARLQKDVDGRVEGRIAEFARAIMPTLDHLEMAKDAARKSKDVDKLMEGIDMIQSEFMRIFDGFGMKEVDCLGKEFDPAVAEAVHMADMNDKEKDGKVIEIVQPGYLLNEKLVRPAKVIVGRFKEEK